MPTRRPTLRVLFTDKDGRAWEIFEHSLSAGKRRVCTPGVGNADYRTFVPVDAKPPRQYTFFRDSPMGGRSLMVEVLQEQLDAADEIRR